MRLLLTDTNVVEDLYCEGVILMHEIWRRMLERSPSTTLLDFPRAVMSAWHNLHRALLQQPRSMEQLRLFLREESLAILSNPKDVAIPVPWYKSACLVMCCGCR